MRIFFIICKIKHFNLFSWCEWGMNIADGDRNRLLWVIMRRRVINDLVNHLRLMFVLVLNYTYTLFLSFCLGNNVIYCNVLTDVSRQKVLFEERFISKALFAMHTFSDFQMNFVVSTERWFMSKRHETSGTLIGFGCWVHECVLLKGRSVWKLFAAKF